MLVRKRKAVLFSNLQYIVYYVTVINAVFMNNAYIYYLN